MLSVEASNHLHHVIVQSCRAHCHHFQSLKCASCCYDCICGCYCWNDVLHHSTSKLVCDTLQQRPKLQHRWVNLAQWPIISLRKRAWQQNMPVQALPGFFSTKLHTFNLCWTTPSISLRHTIHPTKLLKSPEQAKELWASLNEMYRDAKLLSALYSLFVNPLHVLFYVGVKLICRPLFPPKN